MAGDEARTADAGIADPDHRPAAIGLVVPARPHAAFAPLPHIRVLAVDQHRVLVAALAVMLRRHTCRRRICRRHACRRRRDPCRPCRLCRPYRPACLPSPSLILAAFVLVVGVLAIVGTAAVLVLQMVSEPRTIAVLAALLVVIGRLAAIGPVAILVLQIVAEFLAAIAFRAGLLLAAISLGPGLTLVDLRLALLRVLQKLVDLLLVLATRPVDLLLCFWRAVAAACSWLAWAARHHASAALLHERGGHP